MHPEALLKLFTSQEALFKGHFKLSSGLHSDTYWQCAKLQQDPNLTAFLMQDLAQVWRSCHDPSKEPVEAVVGLAMGSIVFAYELARALGCRTFFAERVEKRFVFRRGFSILPERYYIVMEDVITTGGSIQEASALIEEKKGHVAGWACLVDRSTKQERKPYPVFSLLSQTALPQSSPLYTEQECPLCLQRVPIDVPGSRYV